MQSAVKLYEEAISIQGKALGQDHPESAQTLFALAAARFHSGDEGGAREDMARSLEIIDDQRMGTWPVGIRAIERMGR